MEIRHMNNLRISLVLAWLFPLYIFGSVPSILYKEFLFLSLENMLRDLIPSFLVSVLAIITILFIYNEVMLKPLFMFCRNRIDDYRLKYEVIDFLWRWILLSTVILLISLFGMYLVYFSDVSRLGWMIFIEFKTTSLSVVICGGVSLLVITLFLYLRSAEADHVEKDKFENWLETDFPSFPIKSGIILFVLYSIFTSFWVAYISLFINPNLESPMFIILISAVSIILVVSLLYYYLIKRIIGRFLERHELI